MSGIVPELETRRARRALKNDPVSDEAVDRIMTAATLAPSCFNNQSWRFVVVREEAALSLVKSHFSKNNGWAAPSPFLILVATKAELDCRLDAGRDYALFDTGMAVMALQMQAVREGLYVHPIAGYRAPELRAAMGMPEDYILITVLVLGYPADDFTHLTDKQKEKETMDRTRKPLSEVVSRETWSFPQ